MEMAIAMKKCCTGNLIYTKTSYTLCACVNFLKWLPNAVCVLSLVPATLVVAMAFLNKERKMGFKNSHLMVAFKNAVMTQENLMPVLATKK